MKYNVEDHFLVKEEVWKKDRLVKYGDFFCIHNGKTYSSIVGMGNALRGIMTIKELYDLYYRKDGEGICKGCGNETAFKGIFSGYTDWCCANCFLKSDHHKKISSEWFANNPELLERAIAKTRLTKSRRTEEQKALERERRYATTVARYGENYLSERVKKQWEGCDENRRKEIARKAVETRRRNGTLSIDPYKHTNKSVEIDGKEFRCQGYEDIIIQLVYECGFGVDEILIGAEVPRIPYKGNKSGFYRPDIFLPRLNLIIEVKSDYTFAGNIETYRRNVDKQMATFCAGYDHIIIAVKTRPLSESDKTIISEFLDMKISSQARENVGKVQRLEDGSSYRPIAIGSGSARVPKGM